MSMIAFFSWPKILKVYARFARDDAGYIGAGGSRDVLGANDDDVLGTSRSGSASRVAVTTMEGSSNRL
jgi:hypothetical protein